MDTPIFQNATENKDATIRCEVKGNPEPSVSWYYNGQQIVCKYRCLSSFLMHFPNKRRERSTCVCVSQIKFFYNYFVKGPRR